jgi:hypothetical protein
LSLNLTPTVKATFFCSQKECASNINPSFFRWLFKRLMVGQNFQDLQELETLFSKSNTKIHLIAKNLFHHC